MTRKQRLDTCDSMFGLTAMELAELHIEDMNISDPEHAQRVQDTALMVGEYLHGEGQTLCWEQLDAADFFQCIDFMSPRQQEAIALTIMGFYVWLNILGMVPSAIAMKIVSDVAGLFPESDILLRLRGSSERAIHHRPETTVLN